MKWIKRLYLEKNFYLAFASIVLLFVLSHFFQALYLVSQVLLLSFLVFSLIDILILFSNKEGVIAQRILAEKLSNGDDNTVEIALENHYTFNVTNVLIDELPFQFQERQFKIIKKQESQYKSTLS